MVVILLEKSQTDIKDPKVIKINSIFVSQNRLRDLKQVESIRRFAAAGEFFNLQFMGAWCEKNGHRSPQLIQITSFPNALMIHDGHHRCAGILMSCRDYLRDDEYKITKMTPEDYLEMAPQKGWFTPFDPFSEARTPNFSAHKCEALSIMEREGELAAIDYILNNKHNYIERRKIWSVGQLVYETRLSNPEQRGFV
jgi:hypothetical protein